MRAADHKAVRKAVLANTAVDIRVENHGSIMLLTPTNENATLWLDENLNAEVIHHCGSFVVEPRYVEAIVIGARLAGLEVR